MGKKQEKEKEISLDELEEELADKEEVEEVLEETVEEKEGEEEEEEIEEIEEFSLEEVAEKEEIEELFEEEAEELEREEVVEELPKEEEIIDERIYIIPLYKSRHGPRTKWAKKSIRYLRNFMTRHFKPEALIISRDVNEKIWSRGMKKPPRKIKIRATKNIDGLVVCYLG